MPEQGADQQQPVTLMARCGGDDPIAEEVAAALEGHFDHYSPALAEDPHRVFGALRDSCPITRSDRYGGFWVLSSYDDVYEAYHRTGLFSSRTVFLPENPGVERPWIPLEIDPPQHGKYRRVLDPFFGPAKVRLLSDQIEKLATELIDEIVVAGECDFVADFAVRLPAGIFLAIMGLPLSDLDEFLGWVHATIHGVASEDLATSQRIRKEAGESIYGYFSAAVQARSAERGDDFVSFLLDSLVREDDGTTRPLEPMEILDICFLVLNAGLDTVAGVLGLTIKYLAERPDQRERLLSVLREHGELPSVVTEELLRWSAPVLPGRVITEDTTYKDNDFKAGDRVLLVSPAACRDPLRFPDADSLQFDRKDNMHLAFGAGPHRCLGSHLARLEFKLAMELWHRMIPNYEITPGAAAIGHVTMVSGLDQLPLRVHPS